MAYTPKLTYKGKPLVRKDNELYYGSMTDPYVLYLQILTTTPVGEQQVADKVHLMLLSTDTTKAPQERVARQTTSTACTMRWTLAASAAEGQRDPLNQIKMNNAGQSADCPALRFYRDNLEWPPRALWPYS